MGVHFLRWWTENSNILLVLAIIFVMRVGNDMSKKEKTPKIFVDTMEQNTNILNKLLEKPEGVEISMKSGGPGDYIIEDKLGRQWGVERKELIECYQAIITKDSSGTGRIYGQLAELIAKYDGRAIFLLGRPTYFPARLKAQSWIIIGAVYTFFSERSLVMPTWLVRDDAHCAYLLKKMAKNLHKTEFVGRGYKITLIDTKKKT